MSDSCNPECEIGAPIRSAKKKRQKRVEDEASVPRRGTRDVASEEPAVWAPTTAAELEAIAVEMLSEYGVAVVPVMGEAEAAAYATDILEQLVCFKDAFNGPIVVGGFGALGTPDSFHAAKVRELRDAQYDVAKPIVKAAYKRMNPDAEDVWLSTVFDRFMVRTPDMSPTAESNHRDQSPQCHVEPTDLITGGWISLLKTQSLVCFPRTMVETTGPGFSHEEVETKKWRQEAGEETARFLYRYRKVVPAFRARLEEFGLLFGNDLLRDYIYEKNAPPLGVPCPPGYTLIFNQTLQHEVAKLGAGRKKADVTRSSGNLGGAVRLFTGAFASSQPRPIVPLHEVVDNFAVPLLKSSQVSPMVPGIVFSSATLVRKTREMAQNLDSRMVADRVIKVPGEDRQITVSWPVDTGEPRLVFTKKKDETCSPIKLNKNGLKRVAPSLKEAEFPTGPGTNYPKYSLDELARYEPQFETYA